MGRYKLKLAGLALTAGIAISVTSGCSTGATGEKILGLPGSSVWFFSASRQTQIDFFKKSCRLNGFVDGTNEMAQCIQSERLIILPF